jgi:hypothetical protein
MTRVAHIIGNGGSTSLYKPSPGYILTCNLPGMAVENVYASCIVDFKMMVAMAEGSVHVPGEWILGARPHRFCNMNPTFYMRSAPQIKEFFVDLPTYAGNYTNFNCGHMAVYYSVKRLGCKEVNMYGFDSMFELDLRSASDFYLVSDRDPANNLRLTDLWRPIWQQMFAEFPDVQFNIHYKHDKIKFAIPENAKVVVHKK